MPGVPYDSPDVDLSTLTSPLPDPWKIHDENLLVLTVTCPRCHHKAVFNVPRQEHAHLLKPARANQVAPMYGWTTADVPNETFCRCGKEHAGRPEKTPKGCGARFTGLKAIFITQSQNPQTLVP